MKKVTLHLTEGELKVIASALRYTKSYKGIQVYEDVLEGIVKQMTTGTARYHVVQGVLDDGISRYPKNVIVKAKSPAQAAKIAKARLESEASETYTVINVGEARKDYVIYEVI